MRKLLIADDDEQLCAQLVQLLKQAYEICVCRDPEMLPHWLRNDPPDVLVLNLMMVGTDGLCLLKTIKSIGIWPQVLALTMFESPYISNALQELQVSYLITKPCQPQLVAARIQDLIWQKEGAPSADRLRNEIQQLLLRLGVRVYSGGGVCLQEALLCYCRNPGLSMMKELYPSVAQICGGTPTRVERAIRECIQRAWENRDESYWQLYFPTGRDGKVRHPSNSEFLNVIAAHLLHNGEKAINF